MTILRRIITYLVIVIVCINFSQQDEGDDCVLKNSKDYGKCMLLENCEYARNLLKRKQTPQHCGYKGRSPIVCCPQPIAEPIRKSILACTIQHGKKIFGGFKALPQEFRHMALLGYGDKNDTQWNCGGSLISSKFILTAAHCINSRDLGAVRWVRLGELDIKNATEVAQPQDFAVEKIIKHPDYKASSHYNDIALLKLNGKAQLNKFVQTACLHVETAVPKDRPFVATGWGKTDFLGESSSHLLKVILEIIPHAKCAKAYSNDSLKRLSKGIVDKSQICAGGPQGQDTCPGDSGGPLQYKMFRDDDYHYIVGVTSFGKACGIASAPGVYTRVSEFIPWIEETVWPTGVRD